MTARKWTLFAHVADIVSQHLQTTSKLDMPSLTRAGCAEPVPGWLELAQRSRREPPG
jgi:hypothetical protein